MKKKRLYYVNVLCALIFTIVVSPPIQSQHVLFQDNTRVSESNYNELIFLLLDENFETREKAFNKLRSLGMDIAVPILIQALKDKDWQVQVIAAYTLGRFGSDAQSAIPVLSKAIKAENADIRFVAARALGEIGSEAVVPALIEALQDKDENVRVSAAEALKKIVLAAETAVPALTKALWDGNWYVRTRSAEAIAQLGWDAIDLPSLMKPWKSNNPPSSGAIVSLMVAIQPSVLKDLEKIPSFFIKSLQDEEPNIRQSAAIALGEFSNTSLGVILRNETTNALMRSLQDQNAGVRQKAAESLSIYNLPSKEASAVVSALIEALKDQDAGVRQKAAESLSIYNLPSKEASAVVSALIEALKDQDAGVRQSAAESFTFIIYDDLPPKESSAVVSALIKALKDQDEGTRQSAASSLRSYDNEILLSTLSKIVQQKDLDNEIRRSAARLISIQYEINDSNLQIVTQALQDQDIGVRQNAAIALWKNKQLNTQNTLNILSKGLLSEDPLIQLDAVVGLATIGTEAKPVVSSLIPFLQKDIEPLRYSTALAVTSIAPSKECLPILREMLDQETDLTILDHVHLALETINSQEAFSVEIESWEFEDIETRYVTTCSNGAYFPNVFLKSSDSYLLLLQALENENIRSSLVNSMTPYYFPKEKKPLITSNLVNIIIPGLIKVLENKYEGNPALKEIFELQDRDIRRSAAYALGEIANSSADDENEVIIKDKDNKQKIVNALTVVVENQQEDIDIRWMAATSLQKLGINQDSFFTEYNLINPLTVKCPFPYSQLSRYRYGGLRLDRYSAQCYYDERTGCGAGLAEIFSELRRRLSGSKTVKK